MDNKKILKKIQDETRSTSILFLGRHFKNCEIPKLLADLPWSAVFTTVESDTEKFQIFQNEKRSINKIDNINKLRGLKLNKETMPLIFLNDSASEIDKYDKEENREKMFGMIPDILRSYGTFVMCGFDFEDEDEISTKLVRNGMKTLSQRSVFLINKEIDAYLENLKTNKILIHYEVAVEDIFNKIESTDTFDMDEWIYEDTDDAQTIYINNKPYLLSKDLVKDSEKYFIILTQECLNRHNFPYYMKDNYFYKFMKESAEEPQWYGYRCGFHMQRKFEKKLNDLVYKRLASHKKNDNSEKENADDNPMSVQSNANNKKSILLCGQATSGKSNALGALAYKVAEERKYPVIYIPSRTNLNFDNESPEFNALWDVTEKLEDADNILIIWDYSDYKEIKSRNVYNRLINIGRKVVMVSSALKMSEDDTTYNRHYEVVDAKIELDRDEITEFKRIIVASSGMDQQRVENYIKDKLKPDVAIEARNFLNIIYEMLYDTHPIISKSLDNEQKKSIAKLEDAIKNLRVEEEPKTALYKLLCEELKLVESNKDSVEEQEAKKSQIEKNCHKLFASIAFVSQFGYPMPISMAYNIAGIELSEAFREIREAIYKLPWINSTTVAEDLNAEKNAFKFRTKLESELYLEDHNYDEEAQMQLLADMIENVSNENTYSYTDTVELLCSIIMLVGPNSKFENIKRRYCRYYSILIEALRNLREDKNIKESRFILQEIAIMREISKIDKNDDDDSIIEEKTLRLENAMQIADDWIREGYLENENDNTYYMFVIEKVTCEYYIHETKKQPFNDDEYTQMSTQLLEGIRVMPNNSYTYVALLKITCSFMQNHDILEKKRIKAASIVMETIDSADNAQYDLLEDNEEYITWKSIFFDVSKQFDKLEALYESLLQEGNASGLHVKARIMLRKAEIDYKKQLTTDKKNVAQEIINMFEEYKELVDKHNGCIYMLIVLKWLIYNNNPMFETEMQKTYMTFEQWKDISDLCKRYISNTESSDKRRGCDHIVEYIYALSLAQTNNFFESEIIFNNLGDSENMYFGNQVRNKKWHILCDENGIPITFNGTYGRWDKIKRDAELKIKSGYGTFKAFYKILPRKNIDMINNYTEEKNLNIATNYRGFVAVAMDS